MTGDDEIGSEARRDILILAGNAFAAVGAAAVLWPFIAQMKPDAGSLALASTDVDLTPVKEGAAITVMWRGKPVFVRHRTKAEIEAARAVDVSILIDRVARNTALPPEDSAVDSNRVQAGHENWLVVVGICTHLGCIPKGQLMTDARGDFGGWFCVCHGSHYDTAGRIRKGPAPRNLDVPPFTFLQDSKIRIG